MKYLKNLSSRKGYYNLKDGWTNDELIIQELSFWYWGRMLKGGRFLIGYWKIVLPRLTSDDSNILVVGKELTKTRR